ncbi:ArsR/SmtB family transcription factor [Patulibacter americanus]|uniref:ArsR/SmtB family transcription factor n=1 Tax=Patulibacter americanus TaxID=588672 RepID=UPI0003B66EE4|nr:metalloregulator ArsR/SmtB family transcription factor [Patulibacter americanus]
MAVPPSTGAPPVDAPRAAPVVVPARETIRHPPKEALDLSQILRTVGDPLRLSIVRMLADGREMLCGPLGEALGLPKSTGSYHLRLLREAGVTRTRQEGTLRYVSLRRDDLEDRFPGLVDVLTGAQ